MDYQEGLVIGFGIGFGVAILLFLFRVVSVA